MGDEKWLIFDPAVGRVEWYQEYETNSGVANCSCNNCRPDLKPSMETNALPWLVQAEHLTSDLLDEFDVPEEMQAEITFHMM